MARQAGLPAFAAKQMAQWVYERGVADIDEMTNISKAGRQNLKEHYQVGRMAPTFSQTSVDGTKKYLFPTASGHHVECVYIPDGERATLCVSSQVGCKMGCAFCMTGRQGFDGQLTAADILNQIYSLPERDTLTNIVFMGQGEPFDNLDGTFPARESMSSGCIPTQSLSHAAGGDDACRASLVADGVLAHVGAGGLVAPASALFRIHRIPRVERYEGTCP